MKNNRQQTDKLLEPSGLLIKFKQPCELCKFGVARINLWNVNLLIKHARPGTVSRAALLLIGLLCYIRLRSRGDWYFVCSRQFTLSYFARDTLTIAARSHRDVNVACNCNYLRHLPLACTVYRAKIHANSSRVLQLMRKTICEFLLIYHKFGDTFFSLNFSSNVE